MKMTINALVNVVIEFDGQAEKAEKDMTLQEFLDQDFEDYEDFEDRFLAYLGEN